jgi:putative tricarboxylic transport membrane protein
MQTAPDLVWGLIASLLIANVVLLFLNLPMIGVWVRLLHIPAPLLYAGILVVATVGTYGISRSALDLALLYGMGVIGLLMRRFDFPMAPVIIGAILGPIAETQFRRAMTISNGDWTVFVTSTASLVFLIVAVLAFFAPKIASYIQHRRVRGPAHVSGDG